MAEQAEGTERAKRERTTKDYVVFTVKAVTDGEGNETPDALIPIGGQPAFNADDAIQRYAEANDIADGTPMRAISARNYGEVRRPVRKTSVGLE